MNRINREPFRRGYGTETEYSFTLPKGVELTPKKHLYPPGILHVDQILQNGARLYSDVNGVFEYATSIVVSIKDLVTQEIGGEKLVWQAYRPPNTNIITMHKRTISPSGQYSYGSHENYTTPINVNDEDATNHVYNVKALQLFNATRTPLIGAGYVTPKGKYYVGQKMHDIWEEEGSNSTSKKCLVNTRPENHSGGALDMYRLHVVCGDANLSPLVLKIRPGGYSSFLRLLEHGVPLEDLFLEEPPLDVAKMVAGTVDGMLQTIQTRTRKMTALEIQEELLRREDELGEKVAFPSDEKEVIVVSREILEALPGYVQSGDRTELVDQLDWVAKEQRIARVEGKLANRDPQPAPEHVIAVRRAYDMTYDQMLDGTGIRLRKGRFAKHSPDETEIQDALTTPPPGRGQLVGAAVMKSQKVLAPFTVAIGWDGIKITNAGKAANNSKYYKFGPPNAVYTQEEVEEKMEKYFDGVPLAA